MNVSGNTTKLAPAAATSATASTATAIVAVRSSRTGGRWTTATFVEPSTMAGPSVDVRAVGPTLLSGSENVPGLAISRQGVTYERLQDSS